MLFWWKLIFYPIDCYISYSYFYENRYTNGASGGVNAQAGCGGVIRSSNVVWSLMWRIYEMLWLLLVTWDSLRKRILKCYFRHEFHDCRPSAKAENVWINMRWLLFDSICDFLDRLWNVRVWHVYTSNICADWFATRVAESRFSLSRFSKPPKELKFIWKATSSVNQRLD